MVAAVPAHRLLRGGPHADLVGPFLCPASRLVELVASCVRDDVLELGLIVDTGLEGVRAAAERRLRMRGSTSAMVEVPVPAGTDLASGAARADRAGPARTPPPRRAAPNGRLARRPRRRGATRARGRSCAREGSSAELFPTDAELADFIIACAERAVPFKCTAGLHHAVRHTDPGLWLPAPRLPQHRRRDDPRGIRGRGARGAGRDPARGAGRRGG